MEVLLYERVNDLRHSLFHLLNCHITTGSKVWTIGKLRNCVDTHLGQIVCDKDGVVDWCIVLVEISLTRFEECWPLQGISSLKPQHDNPKPNPNRLANQLWCIDYLTPPTPLIIPHRLPAFLESLMPLKNWCSIHARCSKSSLKHSIRFCGIIFSKFKTEFYCISSFLTPNSDNLALVGCIPIAAVAVHLNVKLWKLFSHLIRCIAIT